MYCVYVEAYLRVSQVLLGSGMYFYLSHKSKRCITDHVMVMAISRFASLRNSTGLFVIVMMVMVVTVIVIPERSCSLFHPG
jgi:hypothetical protein